MNVKEKSTKELVSVIKDFFTYNDTHDLAVVFDVYMRKNGARKTDNRRKDNSNTFTIDGDSYGWNKVECYYFKNNHKKYGDSELEIVMRKRCGDYFIISKGLERALEISYGKIVNFNEKLFREIMAEYLPLFEI